MEMIDALESAIKWVDMVHETANRTIQEMNKIFAIHYGRRCPIPGIPLLSEPPMDEIRKCAMKNRVEMDSKVTTLPVIDIVALSEIQSIKGNLELLRMQINTLESVHFPQSVIKDNSNDSGN